MTADGITAVIIEHEFDREQRFCDGHEFAVVELTASVDIGLNGLSVAADVLTGLFGIDQSQSIFNTGKHTDQIRHVRWILVVLAYAQIKRVLDAKNVFFDDRGDAFQQGIVSAKQAAFGMRDFFFIRHDSGQLENFVNLLECRRRAGITCHEIQQLLGQAHGGKVADFADAPVIEEIDLLIDLYQTLFEGIVTFNAAVRKRGKQGRSNPEQFTAGFLTALCTDPATHPGQFPGGLVTRCVIQPTLKMGLELKR